MSARVPSSKAFPRWGCLVLRQPPLCPRGKVTFPGEASGAERACSWVLLLLPLPPRLPHRPSEFRAAVVHILAPLPLTVQANLRHLAAEDLRPEYRLARLLTHRLSRLLFISVRFQSSPDQVPASRIHISSKHIISMPFLCFSPRFNSASHHRDAYPCPFSSRRRRAYPSPRLSFLFGSMSYPIRSVRFQIKTAPVYSVSVLGISVPRLLSAFPLFSLAPLVLAFPPRFVSVLFNSDPQSLPFNSQSSRCCSLPFPRCSTLSFSNSFPSSPILFPFFSAQINSCSSHRSSIPAQFIATQIRFNSTPVMSKHLPFTSFPCVSLPGTSVSDHSRAIPSPFVDIRTDQLIAIPVLFSSSLCNSRSFRSLSMPFRRDSSPVSVLRSSVHFHVGPVPFSACLFNSLR